MLYSFYKMLKNIPFFQGISFYGKTNNSLKYQVVLQHSEEDCGAACLATIAKFYGQSLTISRLREFVGTGQQGTTLLGLKQGAEAIGLNARSVRAASAILDKLDDALTTAVNVDITVDIAVDITDTVGDTTTADSGRLCIRYFCEQ